MYIYVYKYSRCVKVIGVYYAHCLYTMQTVSSVCSRLLMCAASRGANWCSVALC